MMTTDTLDMQEKKPSLIGIVFLMLVVVGAGSFIFGISGSHPERAWLSYLINFLLWSAIAQGAVLFSAVTHLTGARWTQRMSGIAESFAAFFPISFVLFLILFLGQQYVFPWLHHDLHGKEAWLNIPFLFTRDFVGLLILYGLGFWFLYYSLQLRISGNAQIGWLRSRLLRRWGEPRLDPDTIRSRMKYIGGFYILAFALVLTLISFDLVMSMDSHWISTLFGAYSFVKAFYIGLGGLIILSSLLYLQEGSRTGLTSDNFHDVGKLFFAFCFLWGDFFYVQLVVIWYGNIPEESAYVIERVFLPPYNILAWGLLFVCFIFPFLILLNKKIKTLQVPMIILCSVIILGIWFEHLLLLGPPLIHGTDNLPVGFLDLPITLGFLGLMAYAVRTFLINFPEVVREPAMEVR